jgi:hypothetical protein
MSKKIKVDRRILDHSLPTFLMFRKRRVKGRANGIFNIGMFAIERLGFASNHARLAFQDVEIHKVPNLRQ